MALFMRNRPKLHIDLPKPIETAPQRFPTRFFLHPSSDDHHHQAVVIESLSDLERLKVLGSGNGGTVYQVRHKQTGNHYALKLVRSVSDDGRIIDQLVREIEILCSCFDSCNVVRCHGVFEEPFTGDIGILMEYMEMGSLDHLLKTNGSFSERVVSNIAYQALSGLNYLHGKKIVHRDIKPGNLLVDKEMRVKIGDFGVSKVVGECCQINTYVGTCAYMSPERFDSSSDDVGFDALAAGDVWSLGVTLMELYLGHHPYVTTSLDGKVVDNNGSLMWEIICGEDEPPCMPNDVSEDFEDFISCCLQKDWAKRWTASQLLSHPFLYDF